MTKNGPPDKVDAALAAADAPQAVQMAQATVQLMGNPQRPAMIAVPPDITDIELLSLIGNVLGFGDQLRARRQAANGLVVARQMPVKPS